MCCFLDELEMNNGGVRQARLIRQMGQSRPGRASSDAGDVRHAAESGSKFRTLAAALAAVAGCPWRDSSSQNRSLESCAANLSLRMDHHQTDG
jgi:hypothetical protein